MSRKYILTIQCSDRAGAMVERTLLKIAERLQGRLTRQTFEPSDMDDRFVRSTGSKTLRKMGR